MSQDVRRKFGCISDLLPPLPPLPQNEAPSTSSPIIPASTPSRVDAMLLKLGPEADRLAKTNGESCLTTLDRNRALLVLVCVAYDELDVLTRTFD